MRVCVVQRLQRLTVELAPHANLISNKRLSAGGESLQPPLHLFAGSVFHNARECSRGMAPADAAVGLIAPVCRSAALAADKASVLVRKVRIPRRIRTQQMRWCGSWWEKLVWKAHSSMLAQEKRKTKEKRAPLVFSFLFLKGCKSCL